MIIRELITLMRIKFDKQSAQDAENQTDKVVDHAEKKVNGLVSMVGKLGGMFFVHNTIAQLNMFSDMASAAVENLNVLDATFKQNKESVLDWSETVAQNMGRSKYDMQQMVGNIGAVLEPMLDGNREKTTKLAESLSEMAVDLGSFYNKSDQQAMYALRSAMTGESEPMKQFGIIMTDTAIGEWMKKQTDKYEGVKFKTLSQQEKTEARFAYLMDRTKKVQGDAVKTLGEYANSSKAYEARKTDFFTDVGKTLLPLQKFKVNVLDKIVAWFNEIRSNSKLLETALIALGAVLVGITGYIAYTMLPTIAPLILPFLEIMAVVLLLIVAMDELWTMFAGGETVLGDFIDSIFGKGAHTTMIDYIKQSWENLKFYFQDVLLPYMSHAWDRLKDKFGALWESSKRILKSVGTIIIAVFDMISSKTEDSNVQTMGGLNNLVELLLAIMDVIVWIVDFTAGFIEGFLLFGQLIGEGAAIIVIAIMDMFSALADGIVEAYDYMVEKVTQASEWVMDKADAVLDFLGMGSDEEDDGGTKGKAPTKGKPKSIVPKVPLFAGANGKPPVSTNMSVETNINIAGSADKQTVNKVATKTNDVMQTALRNLKASNGG